MFKASYSKDPFPFICIKKDRFKYLRFTVFHNAIQIMQLKIVNVHHKCKQGTIHPHLIYVSYILMFRIP